MGKATGVKRERAVRQPMPEVSWDWPSPVPRTSTLRTRPKRTPAGRRSPPLPRISRKIFRRNARKRAR